MRIHLCWEPAVLESCCVRPICGGVAVWRHNGAPDGTLWHDVIAGGCETAIRHGVGTSVTLHASGPSGLACVAFQSIEEGEKKKVSGTIDSEEKKESGFVDNEDR